MSRDVKATSVGVSEMGIAIARNLIDQGLLVTVVDSDAQAAGRLVEEGARYSNTLADALDTKLIMLNLQAPAIVDRMLRSVPAGRLRGKSVINTTVTTPDEAKAISRLVQRRGGRYLDAKIENCPSELGQPAALIVYSGSRFVFNKYRAVLEGLGRAIYLGPNVAAAAVVDLGVFIGPNFGTWLAFQEGAALALKHGYPIEDFVETLMANESIDRQMLPSVFSVASASSNSGDIDAGHGSVEAGIISLETLLRGLKQSGIDSRFSKGCLAILRDAANKGHGKDNIAAVLSAIYS